MVGIYVPGKINLRCQRVGEGNGEFASFGADNELKFESDFVACVYKK